MFLLWIFWSADSEVCALCRVCVQINYIADEEQADDEEKEEEETTHNVAA